jgi:hypothetical protein
VHRQAGGLEHGAEEGDDGALAVGPGDVDDRRQRAFGMSERGQQPLDAAEGQVDRPGVERLQPLEDGVTGQGRFSRP